jgi:hypothetical protein
MPWKIGIALRIYREQSLTSKDHSGTLGECSATAEAALDIHTKLAKMAAANVECQHIGRVG